MTQTTEHKVRIDKWLWAARFYKTRSLAAHAVEAGKVLVNGASVKPAKALKVGDELVIRTPVFAHTVHVAALSERRSSAVLAAQLYVETSESLRQHDQTGPQHMRDEPGARLRGRPTKRARRQLQRAWGEP
jgi:ribosome-associated heat shock protein Hsp15